MGNEGPLCAVGGRDNSASFGGEKIGPHCDKPSIPKSYSLKDKLIVFINRIPINAIGREENCPAAGHHVFSISISNGVEALKCIREIELHRFPGDRIGGDENCAGFTQGEKLGVDKINAIETFFDAGRS